jgi:hypothetical protein
MPTVHDPNTILPIVQRREYRIELCARQSEYGIDAIRNQGFNNGFTASHSCHCLSLRLKFLDGVSQYADPFDFQFDDIVRFEPG